MEDQLLADVPSGHTVLRTHCVRPSKPERPPRFSYHEPGQPTGEPQLKGGAFPRHTLSHSCGSIRLDAQEGDPQNWGLAETPFVSIGPAVYSLLW